ncbi:hypothetical protein BGZ94_005039, partial [Podila epigama]
HKEQGEASKDLHRAPAKGGNSDDDFLDDGDDNDSNSKKKKPIKKVTKKASGSFDNEEDVSDNDSKKKKTTKKVTKKASGEELATNSSSRRSPSPVTKTTATTTKATTKAPAKRASATKAKKANKKAADDSDDNFVVDSEEEYRPSEDYTEDSDDSDSELSEKEDDLDVNELTDKLKTVRIKPDDPTLPPRPGNAGPRKTKKKTQEGTKIATTNKILPPPKSKLANKPVNSAPSTEATSSSTPALTTAVGFWIKTPAPVKIPESTRMALAAVKDKIKLEMSGNNSNEQHATPEKKSSGFFSYRVDIQSFLRMDSHDDDNNSVHHNDDGDDGKDLSKRAQFKQLFNRLMHRTSKDTVEDKPEKERPLPALPAPASDTLPPETKKPGKQRRGSQASVDSITQDIQDLSVHSQEPVSPTDEIPNQCQGFNSNGYRCKRKVKLDRPIVDGEVLLCHDHEVEDEEVVVHIEGQGGVLLQWLDVSVWVNPHLPDYVQTKLRRAMERPVSDTDKPGYIYTYQLLATRQTKTHTFFKVGRTDNVHRRMNEWSDKCGSPPILLEVFPEQGALAPKEESDLADSPTAYTDKDLTGLRCRYAHRVERLIHIELKPFHDKDHVCSCKTAHREWFMVPHKAGLKDSEQMDQAWGQIRRVIVHWMAYMERVYGPG